MKKRFERQFDKINQINQSYTHLYHELAVHFQLSDSTLQVLYALLWLPSPCSPKDIVTFCCGNKQTIHSTLKKLEANDYLNIKIFPQNRRSRQVFLTEKGKSLAKATAQQVIEIEEKAFAALSEEERENFLTLENKFFHHFRRETKEILTKPYLLKEKE